MRSLINETRATDFLERQNLIEISLEDLNVFFGEKTKKEELWSSVMIIDFSMTCNFFPQW